MMDDLISRQAAIETVEEWFFNLDDNRMPKEVLLEIPPAQQTTCKYWDTESDFCALYRPSAQPDRSLWFRIGEICVDESKGFITAGRAFEKIRELLREAERRTDDTR